MEPHTFHNGRSTLAVFLLLFGFLSGFTLIGRASSYDGQTPDFSEPASESMRRMSDMKGTIIRTFKEEKLIFPGDELILEVDPSSVMKGDLLSTYRVVEGKGKQEKKNPYVQKGGLLRVGVVSENLVTGWMIQVKDLLRIGDKLDYYLPEPIHRNRYFPFLKQVADLYLTGTGEEPISVLFLDVTDSEGNITNISESIFLDMENLICHRPQFKCIPRESYLPDLNRYDVSTSWAVDQFVEQGLRNRLKPDVWIKADCRTVREDRVDVRLTAVDPFHNLDRIDYELTVDPSEIYFSEADPNEILVEYVPVGRAKFHVFYKEAKVVNEQPVRFFHFERLEDKVSPEVWNIVTAEGSSLLPGDFFLELDGTIHRPKEDRVFYSDLVKVGPHRLKIGFFPMIKTGRGVERAGASIQNSFNLSPENGEEWRIEVSNLILGDKAYVMVDTQVVE